MSSIINMNNYDYIRIVENHGAYDVVIHMAKESKIDRIYLAEKLKCLKDAEVVYYQVCNPKEYFFILNLKEFKNARIVLKN